jgi:hypothetical protein
MEGAIWGYVGATKKDIEGERGATYAIQLPPHDTEPAGV